SQLMFQKGSPVTLVQFVPLVISSTGIYKITKFRIEASEQAYSIPSRTLIKDKASPRRSSRTEASIGSVLSSGLWVKFPVTQDGLYKIDYDYLQANGLNPASIDPLQIRLFGNGGGMLPQKNLTPRYDDLIENAIQIVGGGDGSFDQGDYILFYAKGPHTWVYDTSVPNPDNALFAHSYNVYSDQAYYFLTVSGVNGSRVTSKASLGSALQSFNYFDERQFSEADKYNVLKSGRTWYGDLFSTNTFSANSYTFDWGGGRAGSPISVNVAVLGRSNVFTSFVVRINQTTLKFLDRFNALQNYLEVSPLSNGVYPAVGVPVSGISSTTPSAAFDNATISLTFNNGGNFTSQAHLDYIRVQGERDLQLYNSQTTFRCKKSILQATSEYRIQNADNSLSIWDVTDPLLPVSIIYDLIGTEAVFSDQSNNNNNSPREYVCFKGDNFNAPGAGSRVVNQNLHTFTAPNLPDVVIVSHPSLFSEASRLASHREREGLKVIVVTTEQVYNEFSSGAQDITAIRDFMKMLYDRNTSTDSVRFLVLFGSCSYDYKDRVSNNKNLVPCYESYNSLEPLKSYSSEDYYGFMDNGEGRWAEGSAADLDLMDISIGRIPARNQQEASAMVSKIIHYQTSSTTQSKWKNRITFVCDDGDSNQHLKDAEIMSGIVNAKDKRYNLNKIYLDAYPQETAAGGEKSPIVKDLIDKDIAKGVFVLNYSGHGGTGAWSQELILELGQVEAWRNIDALPLVITATCDFGLYDDPAIRSGTDAMLFNENGGGIGIVTSTRVVYQYSNAALNSALYNALFTPFGTDIMPRIGDVFKVTKNKSLVDINNRNYAFLGDPSMKLAYPNEKMVITSINGNAVSSTADTLKALSKVTIKGEVRDFNNVKVSSYKGTASITCFDKKNIITTLGNQNDPYTFNLLNNVFFEGKATIDSGKFSVTFIVPKDIAFLYDQGKISVYGQNASTLDDAGGYYDNIQIGGSNTSAPADNTPPMASLYMNDETFVSGGLTSSSPMFIAKVKDDNGINVGTSGIGHEITITMSNKPDAVILNEYYSTVVDSYTEGSVRYPIKDLPPGNYSLRFKVWDTYNNSTESYLEFVVANTDKMAIDHILNYPNPFSTHTEFHFDQNRAGDDIEVLIQIYTVSGKMIKSIDHMSMGSSTHISGLHWDGRDDFGDKIGKGVYVYKVKVRSLRDGSTTHQFQKLVLLN
ncbi:MAG: type IX secretion system sortase PorU, partial [Cytophagaceae bacterium]|nr:type IX secretion system sortase PorU [Cytophagaceae bacterium]